jgi:hypothetical protein
VHSRDAVAAGADEARRQDAAHASCAAAQLIK